MCVLKWLLFDWLAYLSHSGKLSSCKRRTKSTSYVLLVEHYYTRRLMRKGTVKAFSGKYEIFKYSCSPGFQKYIIENRFEKSWFYHRVMIFSVTPSRQEFLLALWNFSCHCCKCLISVLLRTFFFFFFFFDRTLAVNASLCRCTGAFSPLKPELKKLMWMRDDHWCAAQNDSHNACDISSAPLSSDGLERRISGKAPRHRGWIYSQTRSMGPERPTPLHLELNRQRLPRTLRMRDHVQSASALSAFKKNWSPSCPLNGSFQSPNCPLKGFFHSPNGIF